MTRSNLIFLVIAIVGILSGLIIALQGISHYPSFQPTELSEKFFQDPQGFLLFSSEDIDMHAWYDIERIRCDWVRFPIRLSAKREYTH